MDYIEDPGFTVFKSFEEVVAEFGPPLFQLTQQPSLKFESFEASQSSRAEDRSLVTNSVSLHYTYASIPGGNRATHLRRLVQTLDLNHRDDELATVELLVARHLDASVEVNSDGDMDLPFRIDPDGVVRSASRLLKVDGVEMDAFSVAEHGYIAFGTVIGDRLLSIALPEEIAGLITIEFETR